MDDRANIDGGLELVNAVGSGSLGAELDLTQIAAVLGKMAEYDPERYSGVYLDDDAPLVTFYRTGKYILTGASSEEALHTFRERVLQTLSECKIIQSPDDEWFRVQNLVFSADLGKSINLNALAICLSLDRIEYEPEQFSGLMYRPPEEQVVVLVFSSGKAVITGAQREKVSQRHLALFIK